MFQIGQRVRKVGGFRLDFIRACGQEPLAICPYGEIGTVLKGPYVAYGATCYEVMWDKSEWHSGVGVGSWSCGENHIAPLEDGAFARFMERVMKPVELPREITA